MKRRHERTVITVETIQRTTVRQRRTGQIALCERCAAEIRGHNSAAHVQDAEHEILLLLDEEVAGDQPRQQPETPE